METTHYPNTLTRQQHQQTVQRPYSHGGGSAGGGGGPSPMVEIQKQPSHSPPDDNRSTDGELRAAAALDCNLNSLCDHIQLEGFNNGAFSDVVVHAMGSTYHLHRLILSRSSYFRNMLQGPWKEANAPVLTLHVDDNNVNGEAIAISLAYLYGRCPKLNDNNAFRVLAAASFLDLQDLCAICTDFIISELWTSNFLAYQVFAESQDYGIHGERVRNACWGYLCQSGYLELKEVLPKLSSQTLHALLTSDELWVPNEEKRFELALSTLLAKVTIGEAENQESGSYETEVADVIYSKDPKGSDSYVIEGSPQKLHAELEGLSLKDELDGQSTAHNILVELADQVVDSHSEVPGCKQVQQTSCAQSHMESGSSSSVRESSSHNGFAFTSDMESSCSYLEVPIGVRPCGLGGNNMAMEGPSEEDSCYQLNNNSWLPGDERNCISMSSSCNSNMPSEWGRSSMQPLPWGGRTVGRREVKTSFTVHNGVNREDYDAFLSIFEGGSLLYSNMSFEALLNVRKQLEEMGFPCGAVNDGLWLQMLLSQRVQEVGAETCRNCCLMSFACACRQPFGYSRGTSTAGYYMQEHGHGDPSNNVGNVFVTDSVEGEGNGLFRPVRLHVRGPNDGLAGIGRGTTFVPAAAWPPTRFVFSRVPFGVGSRNCQQSIGNDDPESRADHNGDLGGDGLTALVGLSQGGNNTGNTHGEQFNLDVQSKVVDSSVAGPSNSGVHMQILNSSEHSVGMQWENTSNSISLDMKTPLSHFPPFRFAVEFQDVHRLNDGQVKHSPEVFYAGSLWKVSVQAFSDEDPQGRRTLGLFLHRRKAELTATVRKVHMYIDTREKVTARYQLICPSKREVLVFGSFKQTGTLLPKAPKGWGWRTALLFDELGDLLQNGALRVAAVVQLI